MALSAWGEGLKGPKQIELLPIIQTEIENIQAAWLWTTKEREIQLIDRSLEGLCYFYLRTLRYQEGLKACQLGIDALEGMEENDEPLRVSLQAWKSIFSLNLHDHQSAGRSIDFALKQMAGFEEDQTDFPLLRARLYTTKAIVENYLGNRENAIHYFDRAFAIFQHLQDFSGFSYLMLRAIDTGGVTSEKIFQYLVEAIEYNRKSGDLFNTAYILHTYCLIVAYHFGDTGQAEVLMQEACSKFENLGDPLSKEMSLATVDPILNISGHYEELLRVREKKLDYARERVDRQGIGIYLAEVGETLGHLGRYSAAKLYYQEALQNLKSGNPYQYAFRLTGFGEVLLALGHILESRNVFQESIKGMKIGEQWGLGRALAGLGAATLLMGDREKARETIHQAVQYHFEGHTHYFTHFSLAAYAYLHALSGNSLKGIEQYATLEKQNFCRNSCWFNDLYRKPIYTLARKETPDLIALSEARGQERNLWQTLEQIF